MAICDFFMMIAIGSYHPSRNFAILQFCNFAKSFFARIRNPGFCNFAILQFCNFAKSFFLNNPKSRILAWSKQNGKDLKQASTLPDSHPALPGIGTTQKSQSTPWTQCSDTPEPQILIDHCQAVEHRNRLNHGRDQHRVRDADDPPGF